MSANVHGDPARTNAFAADPIPSGFTPWRFRAGGWDNRLGAPVVSDGFVYVCSDHGHLHALDALTGKPRWVFTAERGLWGPAPVVSDGIVCFSDPNGTVYAVGREDGQLRWKARGDYAVSLVAGGGVVYGADSSAVLRGVTHDQLFAWDAETGEELWSKRVDRSSTLPALADGRLYHNGVLGYLTAFKAKTGKELYTHGSDMRNPGASNTPCVADGFVYASAGTLLFAHETRRGEAVWASAFSNYILDCVAAANGKLYVRDRDGQISALDAADGKVLWRQNYPTSRTPLALHGDAGLLIAGSHGNYLYRIDLATGERIWRRPLGSERASEIFVWNGIAYLTARKKTLITVDATTGRKRGRVRDIVGAAVAM